MLTGRKKFYGDLFGWQIKEVPEMNYWLFTTTGEKPVGGGIMKRQHTQQTITDRSRCQLERRCNE
jgi:predicted enzyme related to lactoylglutathione lyase